MSTAMCARKRTEATPADSDRPWGGWLCITYED